MRVDREESEWFKVKQGVHEAGLSTVIMAIQYIFLDLVVRGA